MYFFLFAKGQVVLGENESSFFSHPRFTFYFHFPSHINEEKRKEKRKNLGKIMFPYHITVTCYG